MLQILCFFVPRCTQLTIIYAVNTCQFFVFWQSIVQCCSPFCLNRCVARDVWCFRTASMPASVFISFISSFSTVHFSIQSIDWGQRSSSSSVEDRGLQDRVTVSNSFSLSYKKILPTCLGYWKAVFSLLRLL